ncbi:MAG: leucine-rich repeat domain-containing protein [Akkermansiaceae bacterium]|nr:leucine-rich repeat domain-containing protein [Akkermansiaceae bacterium]
MKRKLFLLWIDVIIVVFLLRGGAVNAAQSGLFTYEVVNGQAEITAFPKDETGHLDIPAELDGFKVAAITGASPTQGAFRHSNLSSVKIPEGVETIGDHAFYWSRLLAVDFPTSLKRIGANAFGLGSLGFGGEAVVLPDGLEEIGEQAFLACDFQRMIIPDSVTTIGDKAFANCMQMKFLKIGSGMATLQTGAFENCGMLKRVELGDGLVEIGTDCFRGSMIAEVTFPANLTTLGDNAFGFTGNELSINGGTLVRAMFEGDAPTSFGVGVFGNRSSEFVVNFQTGATGFTEPAWQGLRSHEVSVLPSDELQQFGDFIYRVIGDEVEIVGYPKDFAGHIKIPATIEGKPVTGITGAYRGNTFEPAFSFAALTSIHIPEGVEVIGSNAFSICFGLRKVSLPNSLKIIGPLAFYRTNIDELEFGSGLEVIGEFSFPNVVDAELVIPDSVKKVGARAFETSAARSLIVGSSVEEIGHGSLKNNLRLKTILFKGDAPVDLAGLNGLRNNEDKTIYFFAGAQGFSSPTWDVFGDGRTVFNTVEIGSLEPVEEWLIAKGLAISQAMGETLPGSSVSILMSYALGMDPYEIDPTKMPSVEFFDGQLATRFFAGRSDVNYKVEVSEDLSEWEEAGVLVSEADASEVKTARVTAGESKRFLRLTFSLRE